MQKRIAILGAGGLGLACAEVISRKEEFQLVGLCSRQGFLYLEEGIPREALAEADPQNALLKIPGAQETPHGIDALLERHSQIDGYVVALPNLPNTFIPDVMRQAFTQGVKSCFTDALKRTSAMQLLFSLDAIAKEAGSVYITGCGATPGILSTAAVVAAQSFEEVESVEIYWGVGIEHWESYRATVREDIAHQEGMTLEKAKAMSDQEVEAYLKERNFKLYFKDMEHADDLLLERVGVVKSRGQVHVGGELDLASSKKPVTTTMKLTGKTWDGKRSSHTFALGDETSMAANVIGPALGYLKRAIWLRARGICGVFGSTEFLPQVVA